VLSTDAARAGRAGPVVRAARLLLDRYGVAVVCTERRRRTEHGALADGAAVMAGLMAVVRELAPGLDAMIAKGGVTSAEVATTGLGGSVARVAGQIEEGVSLWQVATDRGSRTPVAIVPGNIGDAGTLVRVLAYFRH
jgi:uncharacterized protein YgbK (DUF1537 family)